MKKLGIALLSATILLQLNVLVSHADQNEQADNTVQTTVQKEDGNRVGQEVSSGDESLSDSTSTNDATTPSGSETTSSSSSSESATTEDTSSSGNSDSSVKQNDETKDDAATISADAETKESSKKNHVEHVKDVKQNSNEKQKETTKKNDSTSKKVPFKYALLKRQVNEYSNPNTNGSVSRVGKIGDFITLKGIITNRFGKFYQISGDRYILANIEYLQKLNDDYNKYYVHPNYTHLIRAKKGFILYSDVNLTKKYRTVKKGEYVAVSGIYYLSSGMPKMKFGNLYFTANRSYIETAKLPFNHALLKNAQKEYQKVDLNSNVKKVGKKGDFLTLKGIYVGNGNAFLKVTHDYYILADFNNLQNLSDNYQNYYVHVNYTKKVKVKTTFVLYSDLNTKHKIMMIRKGSYIRVTGMAYTSTGIPKLMMGSRYLTAKRSYVTTSTSSKIFLNIKNISQNPEYPTGCEAVATTMMLQGAGYNVSKQQVVNAMPRTNTHDGNLGFIGEPSSESGWWIYPPAMVKVVQKYTGSGSVLTGTSFNSIKKRIDGGYAVVVWISGYGGPMTKINHAITITGYDSKNAYFNDPWTGKQLKMTIKQLHNYRKADAYRAIGM
jgi:uncharacterized protein YvpB